MKFAFGILLFTFGYTLFYYGLDQIAYNGHGLSFGATIGLGGFTDPTGGVVTAAKVTQNTNANSGGGILPKGAIA